MTDLSKMTLEELYALADTDIRIKQRRGDPPLPNPIAGPETRKRVKDARAYLKEHNLLGQKVTQGSNSRYNVCAVDGTPIDDRVIDGQRNMPLPDDVTQRVTGDDPHARMIDLICDLALATKEDSVGDFMQRARDILNVFEADDVRERWRAEAPAPEPVAPHELKAWMDWAEVTQRVTWDLRDEDGDLHSPSWYLDAYITAREAYQELHAKVCATEGVEFDGALDDAYIELEMYGNYVNRMFGSAMTEGDWNGPKDE